MIAIPLDTKATELGMICSLRDVATRLAQAAFRSRAIRCLSGRLNISPDEAILADAQAANEWYSAPIPASLQFEYLMACRGVA